MRWKTALVAILATLALGIAAGPAAAWHDYYNPWSYTTPIAYQCYPITGTHPGNPYPENQLAYDVGTPVGRPVFATKSGRIAFEGWQGIGGIVIRIQHYDSPYNSGLQTVLAHLSQTIVDIGQWVNQNQLIGYTGNTGNTTGAHLHWGLWEPATNQAVPLDNIPGVNTSSGEYPYWHICP
jgi:murein DD-endopeptidase MepM/ murein hydrolase activator NlpD